MKPDLFMWRMKAKEIRDHFQEADEQSYRHGVTNTDITKAFNKADELYEALLTIERKVEEDPE